MFSGIGMSTKLEPNLWQIGHSREVLAGIGRLVIFQEFGMHGGVITVLLCETGILYSPLQQLLGLTGLAGAGWSTSYANFTMVANKTIPKLDWLRRDFGRVNESIYHIKYYFDYNTPTISDDELVFEELLIPAYYYVVVTYEWHKLSITTTADYGVSLGGSYNLSGSYDETIWGHNVEIKLADRYRLAFRAIENASGDYSLKSGFSINGKISVNASHTVQFDNGTPVPEARRPKWLRSYNSSTDGSWSFKYGENGTFFGVSALQGIIQGMLTTLSNESYADLVIWGGWKTGRMIGFVDDDGNDRSRRDSCQRECYRHFSSDGRLHAGG
jgi:hypothetical protein